MPEDVLACLLLNPAAKAIRQGREHEISPCLWRFLFRSPAASGAPKITGGTRLWLSAYAPFPSPPPLGPCRVVLAMRAEGTRAAGIRGCLLCPEALLPFPGRAALSRMPPVHADRIGKRDLAGEILPVSARQPDFPIRIGKQATSAREACFPETAKAAASDSAAYPSSVLQTLQQLAFRYRRFFAFALASLKSNADTTMPECAWPMQAATPSTRRSPLSWIRQRKQQVRSGASGPPI